MKQFIEKRPTAVSVIGWFWIIVGGFMALTSLEAFQQGPPSESVMKSMSVDFPLMATINHHYILLAFFLFLFGDLAVILGICFLQLRGWAGLALEILSWFSLGLIAATLAYALICFGAGFAISVQMILFTGFYWIPLVFVIRSLRSRKVRDAVALPQPDPT